MSHDCGIEIRYKDIIVVGPLRLLWGYLIAFKGFWFETVSVVVLYSALVAGVKITLYTWNGMSYDLVSGNSQKVVMNYNE